MIFTGSMQDIRRRICRDDFTLELEGDPANISRLAREAASLEGIEVRVAGSVPVGASEEVSSGDPTLQTSNSALLVRVANGRSRSRALAAVLQLVDACGLSLLAVHSGQNVTENAYLQLLQEDEAHGFHR
jgi:hypothetical protein